MASNMPNSALANLISGTIDLDTDDIRVALLMTNTTADTEVDAIADLADYSTLDECDSTGYARVALTGEAVAADDANDRAEFDANDASFTSLGGDATRAIQGALVYKHVDGTDANDLPICFVDFTSDIPTTATQIDIPWNAEGILQHSFTA
jgi:hypothetical protein